MSSTSKIIVVLIVLSTVVGLSSAVGATGTTLGGDQANENSEADITVTFSENCEDFTVKSSKDISFVSINENVSDFNYTKFEGEELQEEDAGDSNNTKTFSYDGDTELKSVVVKSGSTMEVFNCTPGEGGEVDADPDEQPECSDEIDNDGDNATDHPDDDGCETPDDDDERPVDDGDDNGDDDDDDDDDDDNGDEEVECSGEGDPIAVGIGGESSGNENAENDDNVVDANVQTESDHESDCDNVDADVGQHSTNGDADDDDIDVDAGTNNTAVSDDDGLDVDLGSESDSESDDDQGSFPP